MRLPLKILAITLVGGALLLVAGSFLVPPAAKSALAEGSRAAFGVPSSIAAVGASPGVSTTSVEFVGYRLETTDGFTEPILTIGRFDLGVGTRSLLGETKEIAHLVLEEVVLTIEQDGANLNVVPIIQHVRALGSSSDGPPAPDSTTSIEDGGEPEAVGPRLRIGKVDVRGLAARVKLAGVAGVGAYEGTVAVPDFVEDFGGRSPSGGASIPEIAGVLVESLLSRVLDEADGEVPSEVFSALEIALETGLDGGLGAVVDGISAEGQRRLEQGEAALQKATERALEGSLDDAQSALEEGLSGLLGGDRDRR